MQTYLNIKQKKEVAMYRIPFKNIIRKTTPYWVVTLWVGVVFTGFSLFTSPAPRAAAATCKTSNIMYCGLDATSLQTKIDSFRNAYNANKDSNGRGGIQTGANWSGFNAEIVAGMNVTNTKVGRFYTDGRIVVSDRVINDVSQKAWVTTRYSSDSGRISLGDGIYARPVPSSQTVEREVIVVFDHNAVPLGVVMTDCGNTIKFTGLPVVAECTGMNAPALVDRTRRLYSFTANVRTQNTTLTGASFNFGDGTTAAGAISGTTVTAQHSYAKAGTYTITTTVSFNIFGYNETKVCKTSLTIDEPNVTIQKKVGDVEAKEVKMNENFIYKLIVTNTGTTNLANVVVTDVAPTNIKFVSGDGPNDVSADGKTYRHIIPSIAKGASVTLNITAKVVTYSVTPITNKACVNAPEVNPETPSKDDACDTAVVTLPTPFYECSSLSGPLLDKDKMSYRFTANAKYGNGAVLKHAVFTFGDGKTRTVQAVANSTVITVDYTYSEEGKYTANAQLYFDVYGTQVAAKNLCYAVVEPKKPAVPQCKPGIPVGDIRCTPCEYDASIPKNDPRCVEPTVPTQVTPTTPASPEAPAQTLPNTGAGNVIALASAALIGGFLWYRHILFRRHKRAYLQADFGTSPLPLAEPLESPDPLAATPLAPQAHRKFSMRRRRQF